MKTFLKQTFLFFFVLFSSLAFSESESIHGTASHIVILNADLEFLYGTYYFAVINNSSEDLPFSTTLSLPQQATGITPGENLEASHIESSQGVVSIHRSFPPGMTLAGVRFKSPVLRGNDSVITFTAPSAIKQFAVATNQEHLSLTGTQFKKGLPSMLEGSSYSGILRSGLQQGDTFEIRISGIPGDRTLLWVLSALTACLLFLGLAIGLFWKNSRVLATKETS